MHDISLIATAFFGQRFRHRERLMKLHQTAVEAAAEAAARVWHVAQYRKYTKLPYETHLENVRCILEEHRSEAFREFGQRAESMFCAAWLHDAVEDQNVELKKIGEMFGFEVERIVCDVTDVSRITDGNRALRKAIDARHLSRASAEGQYLKLADIIDNTRDITQHDPSFAAVYLSEKKRLMVMMGRVKHTELYARATEVLREAEEKLNGDIETS